MGQPQQQLVDFISVNFILKFVLTAALGLSSESNCIFDRFPLLLCEAQDCGQTPFSQPCFLDTSSAQQLLLLTVFCLQADNCGFMNFECGGLWCVRELCHVKVYKSCAKERIYVQTSNKHNYHAAN